MSVLFHCYSNCDVFVSMYVSMFDISVCQYV